jgi:DNA-binding PadR family transcriptional regulator
MGGDKKIRDEVLALLPLSPIPFFVLFALAEEEMHGYRIMQEVGVLSGGRLKMGPATLYTTIQRLFDQGLIKEVEGEAGDRRRTYRLSKMGRKLLRAELERQQAVVVLARAKKLIPEEGV